MALKRKLREIHFVCRKGLNVKDLGSEFLSGKWAVSTATLKTASGHPILFGLHEHKNELSYLQGEVIDWKIVLAPDKQNKSRIQFRVRKTTRPLPWRGAGSGEKGYVWEE